MAHQGGQFQGFNRNTFVYSCTGSKIFRHNLGLNTEKASQYSAHIENRVGDAYITALTADLVTVSSSAITGAFDLVIDSPITAP